MAGRVRHGRSGFGEARFGRFGRLGRVRSCKAWRGIVRQGRKGYVWLVPVLFGWARNGVVRQAW